MTAVEFKELKVNDRVKTLNSGMATVVKVGCYGGTMVKLDCDIKKWDCPYFYESELDLKTNNMTAVEYLVSKILVKSEGEWIDEQRTEYINAYKGHVDLSNYVADALEMEKQQKIKYNDIDMIDYAHHILNNDVISPEEWVSRYKHQSNKDSL